MAHMRNRLLRQDFIGGLAIVAAALFAYWLARNLPAGAGGGMGPGTLPRGLAALLGLLGAALVLSTFFEPGALFAPKGLPQDIATKLSTTLVAALDDENTRKRLLELGSVIPDKAGRSPQALQKLVESEVARWTPILKAAGAVGQ